MSEENIEQDQFSYSLTQRLMGMLSVKKTKMDRLLCKIFGHKNIGWSIKVEDFLTKSITHYCERCGHEEVIEMGGGTDRLDVAVAFAMGKPGVALGLAVGDIEIGDLVPKRLIEDDGTK
jgi:hypothetical protein